MSATTSTTATDAVSKISTYIPISYITAENTINETNVNFNITFGKGKDSLVYTNEWDLKEFTKKYEVETKRYIILILKVNIIIITIMLSVLL